MSVKLIIAAGYHIPRIGSHQSADICILFWARENEPAWNSGGVSRAKSLGSHLDMALFHEWPRWSWKRPSFGSEACPVRFQPSLATIGLSHDLSSVSKFIISPYLTCDQVQITRLLARKVLTHSLSFNMQIAKGHFNSDKCNSHIYSRLTMGLVWTKATGDPGTQSQPSGLFL